MIIKRVEGKGYKQLQIAIKELKNKNLKVGWFAHAKYPNTGVQAAYVATIQEFGAPAQNIPARPFMRPTVIKYQEEWKSIAERGAKAVINGTTTSSNVLTQLGERASRQVVKTISEIFNPPLKPATIKRRQSKYANKNKVGNLYKPLVDTGYMISSISFEISEGVK